MFQRTYFRCASRLKFADPTCIWARFDTSLLPENKQNLLFETRLPGGRC